jgi:heme oxygenase
MSAIASMRAATWPSHQRLEKALDMGVRMSSLGGYRAYLEGMWGFCARLERLLEPALLELALPDYALRRKLPLLAADLAALGADDNGLRRLPVCGWLPDRADLASSLGCAYVLEGATLGGRTMLPLVHRRLGLTPQRGAAFLASYGENVTEMWQVFGVAFDRWCAPPAAQASAAAAALATFDALNDWFCGARA